MSMRWRVVALTTAAGFVAQIAFAEPQIPVSTPSQPPAPASVSSAPELASGALSESAQPYLAAGAPIIIEITEPISTTTVKRGDKFAIRLAAPVVSDGKILIPAGVTGVGQVVDAASGGAFGKPAKLLLVARYLDFNGTHIPLRGMKFGSVGEDRTNTAVVGALLVGPLAGFIRGGEIDVPVGAQATAKIAADFPAPPIPTGAPILLANRSEQGKTQ